MSELANFTVGIKNKKGELIGTGFVIAEGVIVTCAHVLRRDVFARNPKIGEQVTIVFSVLDKERVTQVEGYDGKRDVAILKSLTPLPKGVTPAILCHPDDISKPVEFVTLGYRRLGKSREGIPAHGKLVERVAKAKRPQLILESKQIAPGMSGAPLYIPSVDRVVGIITSYWDAEKGRTKRDSDTAFAVPNDAIQEVWPTLGYQKPSLHVLFQIMAPELLRVLLPQQQKSNAWQQVAWEEAASKYTQKVGRLYGTMRVLGKPEPVSLEGIYTDVHLLDTLTALRRYSKEQLEEEFTDRVRSDREKERRDGFDVVQQQDKLFVLGQPGAGKTTFLKYMTLQAVKGRIQKVPIFVSLKELADSGQKVLPFMVQQFQICDFPDAGVFVEQLLNKGQALVLFDGLDEVSQEERKRANLIQELNNFTRQYDTSHYIITCRIAATEYKFELFTYVEMADFTPEQVKAFVGQWFKHDKPKREGFLQGLQKEAHRGLREMTSHPLLLTMLCLTFEETLTFPARRVEIYEEALDALLKKWDSSRNIQRDEIYRTLSLGRKRQLFARIAAETFEQGSYFIPQAELAKKIEAYLRNLPSHSSAEEMDGLAILKAIEAQHGIFSERARGIYSFAHLTFQEYFAAKYIVDNEARGTATALIAHHLGDNRWREVFLLTASLLDDADDFFECFLQQLNQPLNADRALLTRLIWADKKATNTSSIQRVALRSHYIYIQISFEITRGLDLDLGRGLDLDLARALDLDLARALALDRARALDRALDRALARALDLDRALYQFHTKSTLDIVNLNLQFALIWLVTMLLSKIGTVIEPDVKISLVSKLAEVVDQMVETSQQLGEVALHQALEQITLADASASEEAWQTTYREFEHLINTYFQFERDQPLNSEQYERLSTYLEGTEFLLECLELAYVSDREAIYAQVLLPPMPVEAEEPVEQALRLAEEGWGGRWRVGLFIAGLLFAGWLAWWVVLG